MSKAITDVLNLEADTISLDGDAKHNADSLLGMFDKPKIVHSYFDGSGLAVIDYAKAGYKCLCFNSDDADHGVYKIKTEHPNITYVDVWIDDDFDPSVYGTPSIIFAFPDCTNLSGSGSQHERSEQDIEISVNNAKVVERLANRFNCPYYIENPVGKMSTKFRKPNYYFDPYEYGGYLTGEEEVFHPRMPKFDAYTKKTCLFTGNGFIMPPKKPVEHIGFCWSWKYLGGKSAKTKVLRSLTPRGFAKAVFLYNKGV